MCFKKLNVLWNCRKSNPLNLSYNFGIFKLQIYRLWAMCSVVHVMSLTLCNVMQCGVGLCCDGSQLFTHPPCTNCSFFLQKTIYDSLTPEWVFVQCDTEWSRGGMQRAWPPGWSSTEPSQAEHCPITTMSRGALFPGKHWVKLSTGREPPCLDEHCPGKHWVKLSTVREPPCLDEHCPGKHWVKLSAVRTALRQNWKLSNLV